MFVKICNNRWHRFTQTFDTFFGFVLFLFNSKLLKVNLQYPFDSK